MKQFHGTNLPFEEFTTAVLNWADSLTTRDEKSEFARCIFSTDWSNYHNVRNGCKYTMSSVLADGRRSEQLHVGFMQLFYPNHDHSKDDYYILICTLRYRFPDFDVVKYSKTAAAVVKEFERHYACEAHHPEIELLTNHECTESEVEETAVDRMARNFQFSANGTGNDALMKQYQPRWSKNAERNSMIYNGHIKENYNIIGAAWRDYITAN